MPAKISKQDWENRVIISSSGTIKVLSWAVHGMHGAHDKINLECLVDGHVWSAEVNDIHKGSGCPACKARKVSESCRKPQTQAELEISSIPSIRFIGWSDCYTGSKSKAIVSCCNGHSWSATVNNLIRRKSGCPECSISGFKSDRHASLYALISSCGSYIKIGISNDFKTRYATLKRKTPFEWHCLHSISTSGGEAQRLEAMLHSKHERAEFGLKFDGYTEWLICTPELLEEIRSIANGNS